MTILAPIQAAAVEFAPEVTYLNTSSWGLLPRRTIAAVKALADENAAGRRVGAGSFEAVEAARVGFARLVGVHPDRVATGSSVTVHVGLIAASLPSGAEVLCPEGEFSSVVSPFALRGDLRMRYAPLADLAGAVRESTALVAFSAVQSADGRVADLDAVRAAAAAARGPHPAGRHPGGGLVPGGRRGVRLHRHRRLQVPALPARYVVPDRHRGGAGHPPGPLRGLGLRRRPLDEQLRPAGAPRPHRPGLRRAARLPLVPRAEHSLALLAEVGSDALYAHATGLAARLREGLANLGHKAVPGESAIVAVPGLDGRHPELVEAGIAVSAPAGNLRISCHLYNTEADVDRLLDFLA